MGLITPGYFPANYFPSGYWADDYWMEYGAAAITPYPLYVAVSKSLEYSIIPAQSVEYTITISK